MQGYKFPLYVGASAHFLRGANQHPYLAGAYLAEQFFLLHLRTRRMDIGDLFRWNALGNQFVAQVVIDIKLAVLLGSRQVAEHHLCGAFVSRVEPLLKYIFNTGAHLAGVAVGEHGVKEPLVKGQLAPIVGNEQHIVHCAVHHSVADTLGPLSQRRNHFLLLFRGFQHDVVVVGFWYGKVKHIRRLDVRHFLEHGDKFREVIEACEPGLGPVAGALRGQLYGGDGFPKGGRPCVKVKQAVSFQGAVLQIFLHGIHLHHCVGDGGACGKGHASAACQLIQIAAFTKHIAGFLRLSLGDTCHIPHFGV